MSHLRQAWNSNMRLKYAVKWLALKGIDKQKVVDFYRVTCRKYGYSGSIPVPKMPDHWTKQYEVKPAWYREWKGEIGAGALLKQIIKENG